MTANELIGCYNYEQGTININNTMIFLTKKENELFNVLIRNYGKFVSSEIISKKMYNEKLDEGLNLAIRTCASRTRKKLKGLINIKNRSNYGYKLEVIKNEY